MVSASVLVGHHIRAPAYGCKRETPLRRATRTKNEQREKIEIHFTFISVLCNHIYLDAAYKLHLKNGRCKLPLVDVASCMQYTTIMKSEAATFQ